MDSLFLFYFTSDSSTEIKIASPSGGFCNCRRRSSTTEDSSFRGSSFMVGSSMKSTLLKADGGKIRLITSRGGGQAAAWQRFFSLRLFLRPFWGLPRCFLHFVKYNNKVEFKVHSSGDPFVPVKLQFTIPKNYDSYSWHNLISDKELNQSDFIDVVTDSLNQAANIISLRSFNCSLP